MKKDGIKIRKQNIFIRVALIIMSIVLGIIFFTFMFSIGLIKLPIEWIMS